MKLFNYLNLLGVVGVASCVGLSCIDHSKEVLSVSADSISSVEFSSIVYNSNYFLIPSLNDERNLFTYCQVTGYTANSNIYLANLKFHFEFNNGSFTYYTDFDNGILIDKNSYFMFTCNIYPKSAEFSNKESLSFVLRNGIDNLISYPRTAIVDLGNAFEVVCSTSFSYMMGESPLYLRGMSTYTKLYSRFDPASILRGLIAPDEYYQNGVNAVLNNPNSYNLYTQEQYTNYGIQQYNLAYEETSDVSFAKALNQIFRAPITMFEGAFNWNLPLPDGNVINIQNLMTFILSLGVAFAIWSLIKGIK